MYGASIYVLCIYLFSFYWSEISNSDICSDFLYSKIIKAFKVNIFLENVFKLFLVYYNLGLGKGKSCRMSESLAPTPHNHDVNKLLKGQYYS